MVTNVRLPQKEVWMYQNNSVLQGWRPKTESDQTGFGRMIVESLEDASDLMDHVSIEDNSQELSNAVSAIKFDSSGKGSRIVKNSREHIQAERNLTGKMRRN